MRGGLASVSPRCPTGKRRPVSTQPLRNAAAMTTADANVARALRRVRRRIPVLEPAAAGRAERFARGARRGGRSPGARLPRRRSWRLALARGVLDPGRPPARRRRRRSARASASADERFDGFLAHHRDGGRTEASLIGSIMAGGVVLPIVAGVARARLRASPAVAYCRLLRVRARGRVGCLPDDDVPRPPAPAARAPARAAARERELSVGSHGSLDRRLLRARAAPDLAAHERVAARRRLVGRRRHPGLRRLFADVPRHAPSARLPRRRRDRRRGARGSRLRLPAPPAAARPAGRADETVAVIAHAGKTLGGGLPGLRRALEPRGVPNPLWAEVPKSKKAPKQVERALEAGADLIFAWGGDGLVQRCLDVVAGTKAALAIVPAGTANLLATNLGIPKDIEQAVEVGLEGERRRLDVGRLNGERFGVMAGAGFDAAMIHDADGALKDRLGRAAYIWTGAAACGRSRSRPGSRSTESRGTAARRAASSSATSATCSAASRSSTAPARRRPARHRRRHRRRRRPVEPDAGPDGRGQPERSPFVRVTKAAKFDVEARPQGAVRARRRRSDEGEAAEGRGRAEGRHDLRPAGLQPGPGVA